MRCASAAVSALLVGAFALGSCGGGTGGAVLHPDPHHWLSVDAAARSATITLVAERDASYGGFNLDGAAKGALMFSVPSGWRVLVRCVNNSSTRRYACGLQRAPGAHPSAHVFTETPQPTAELAPGEQDSFSFEAAAPDRYRLVGVTEGREPAGMWLSLRVIARGSPAVRWVH